MSEQGKIRRQYWDEIYSLRPAEEMGWHQDVPEISLSLIRSTGLSKEASIIDIGAGESSLPRHLMDSGVSQLTILDVSEKAIQKSRELFKEGSF